MSPSSTCTSNFINNPLYLIQKDTWPGFSFQINLGTKESPVYQNLTGCSAEMQIRQAPNTPVLLDIKSSDGYITFPNPITGTVKVGPVKINLDISTIPYVYDIPITFPDGTITTYIGGQATVRPKITHG